MKKLLALMLAAALALSMVACGGDSGTGDINTPNGSGTPTAEAPRHPQGNRGMVLGKFQFDFLMLVFSADFPTDTKSRWKRTKTAGTATKGTRTQKCSLVPFVGILCSQLIVLQRHVCYC